MDLRVDRPRRSGSPSAAAWLLLAGLVATTSTVRAEPRCLDAARVCLDVREQSDAISFVVTNREAAPFFVRVLVTERHNLASRTPLPFRAVIEAGEERTIGSLDVVDRDRGTRYVLSWDAALGDVLARHAPETRYRMPFGGSSPRVLSQGEGGAASHRGRARYSFDFAMPWGTPVLAARAGLVVRVVDSIATGGRLERRFDQANQVEVLHDDGTLATYAHLRQGAAVRVGQTLRAGEQIGFSGDTGASSGPHLHFMVWKREPDLSWSSLPIRFDDGSPQGLLPQPGLAYAPSCPPGGPACIQDAWPAAPAPPPARENAPPAKGLRRSDGACVCPNGAVIHVELACELVCGR